MNVKTECILVTGGLGYVGSHICLELLNKTNFSVLIVDDLSNSDVSVLQKLQKYDTNSRLGFVKMNLLENNEDMWNFVFQNRNVFVVIHLAAFKCIEESFLLPLMYFENNVGSTVNLLKYMKRNMCNKIIFSSSAAVYGHPKDTPVKENNELNPISPYGISKLMCEQILRNVNDIECVILRYFNPIGCDFRIGEPLKNNQKNLMPILMNCLNDHKCFEIRGNDYNTIDGTPVRDFIHVIDLAHAHTLSLDLLKQKDKHHEHRLFILNVGSGKGTSVLQFVSLFQQESKRYGEKGEFSFTVSSRREGDPPELCACTDLSREILNWTPSFTIQDAIISSLQTRFNGTSS